MTTWLCEILFAEIEIAGLEVMDWRGTSNPPPFPVHIYSPHHQYQSATPATYKSRHFYARP